jgi:hypothetical protein
MQAYKLFRVRPDGSLGSLFINRGQRLEVGSCYFAQSHPTNGFKVRPGWHCCSKPIAPHLSKKGRVWCRVNISGIIMEHDRPVSQGGLWYTASVMRIEERLQ